MNSSLQTNDWKKTLQTFLKGSGKSLMKDFNNKTILVSLTGGTTHIVESDEVDSFMEGKGIKSVSQQHLQFKPTENNTMKAYFKEASGKGKVNLIVFNSQEDLDQRNNLFILNDLQQLIEENPQLTNQALSQFNQEVFHSNDPIEHLSAKIAKIIADSGFPLAYLVIFKDNSKCLKQLTQKYNSPQYQESEFRLQKAHINPLYNLFEELQQVDKKDYCKVYQKYGLDHSKISNLCQYISSIQGSNKSEDQKKDINNLVMSYLKLDINNPKIYIQSVCGEHCQRQCIMLTKFLQEYLY